MPHVDADIIFVDDTDNVIGFGERKEAVEKGIIHRIVRVLVFNDAGDLLIQKRGSTVSIPERWDDSAAGHVDADEEYYPAALRELKEEVGIANTPIQKIAKYYSEDTDDGITKKRFNTIYSAIFNGPIDFDTDEVSEILWISLEKLQAWMASKPKDFTDGFFHCLEQYQAALNS